MGQKVNPIGLRIGVNRTWDSRWFAHNKEYPDLLHRDLRARKHIEDSIGRSAGIGKIVIERVGDTANISLHSSRPGVIVGKKGQYIEQIKKELSEIMGNQNVSINLVQVKRPESDAKLIADGIAHSLEGRAFYRRVMKRAVQSAMRLGIEGIRINCSGRLGGAEIARMEWYREGRVPLHTLRADIDYGESLARLTYGSIGIKVWVFKGEILNKKVKRN